MVLVVLMYIGKRKSTLPYSLNMFFVIHILSSIQEDNTGLVVIVFESTLLHLRLILVVHLMRLNVVVVGKGIRVVLLIVMWMLNSSGLTVKLLLLYVLVAL